MTATHSASVLCRASPQQALHFLGDGLALGQWALGCWQTEAVGGGVVRGHSLFDDTPSWVRPVVDSARLTAITGANVLIVRAPSAPAAPPGTQVAALAAEF